MTATGTFERFEIELAAAPHVGHGEARPRGERLGRIGQPIDVQIVQVPVAIDERAAEGEAVGDLGVGADA